MDKQWDRSRRRYTYRPTKDEAVVVGKVCEVILQNPDHFPPDTFEAGIANSVQTLLHHGEGWTKDQALGFDGILNGLDLGHLSIPGDGSVTPGLVTDLFEGIQPLGGGKVVQFTAGRAE